MGVQRYEIEPGGDRAVASATGEWMRYADHDDALRVEWERSKRLASLCVAKDNLVAVTHGLSMLLASRTPDEAVIRALHHVSVAKSAHDKIEAECRLKGDLLR